jgi:hypothetical protein
MRPAKRIRIEQSPKIVPKPIRHTRVNFSTCSPFLRCELGISRPNIIQAQLQRQLIQKMELSFNVTFERVHEHEITALDIDKSEGH